MHPLVIVPIIILIAVALLLLIPFHLKLDAVKEGSTLRGSYRVSWAGLVLKKGEISPEEEGKIKPEDIKAKEIMHEEARAEETALGETVPEETEAGASKDGPEMKKRGVSPRSPKPNRFNMPVDPRLFMDALPDIMHSTRGFIKTISVSEFYCHLVMGLSDPADTAFAFGIIWSIISSIAVTKSKGISLEPDFIEEKLDASVTTDFKVRLISIFAIFIESLSKKPIRKLMFAIMGDQIGDKRSRAES
jgi:hypothetical protein